MTQLLEQMHELLLGPMGVEGVPSSIAEAVESHLKARGEIERRYDVRVDRRLEDAVRARLRAAGI